MIVAPPSLAGAVNVTVAVVSLVAVAVPIVGAPGAIGGGVIQDIATFSASIYMRGVSWTYYPTTLLGMVDSCIGGKSSINVGKYKNIAGNFYPPNQIVISTNFCDTLPASEIIAGLCEAAKICFADVGSTFEQYLSLMNRDGLVSQGSLLQVIKLSLHTKKKFIEEDEFDQDARLLLNFGHTFAHAIEAASNFSITHGVAVGVGMLIAIDLSTKLNPMDACHTRVTSLSSYLKLLLGNVHSLPENLGILLLDDVFNKFKSDKKHRQHEYVVIVPGSTGHLCRQFISINIESDNLIRDSFNSVIMAYEV